MKYLVIISVSLVLFSCQKDSQPKLITQLGFDISKTAGRSNVTIPSIYFKSMEDAKVYLSDLKDVHILECANAVNTLNCFARYRCLIDSRKLKF